MRRRVTSSQAPSYASPKLSLTHTLTGVKCRATSVAKKISVEENRGRHLMSECFTRGHFWMCLSMELDRDGIFRSTPLRVQTCQHHHGSPLLLRAQSINTSHFWAHTHITYYSCVDSSNKYVLLKYTQLMNTLAAYALFEYALQESAYPNYTSLGMHVIVQIHKYVHILCVFMSCLRRCIIWQDV